MYSLTILFLRLHQMLLYFFTILLLNHKNMIWLMAIYWLKFKVCFNAQCFKLFAYVSYSPPMHMALSNL